MANVFDANDAWAFGLLKWMTVPSSLIIFTSSMPGIVFTDSFFNDDCNFLSSVAAVWCTIFFLRLGVPLPPILTCCCNFFSLSVFILHAINLKRKPIRLKFSSFSPILDENYDFLSLPAKSTGKIRIEKNLFGRQHVYSFSIFTRSEKCPPHTHSRLQFADEKMGKLKMALGDEDIWRKVKNENSFVQFGEYVQWPLTARARWILLNKKENYIFWIQ